MSSRRSYLGTTEFRTGESTFLDSSSMSVDLVYIFVQKEGGNFSPTPFFSNCFNNIIPEIPIFEFQIAQLNKNG